jgi:ribosomal protein S3AE
MQFLLEDIKGMQCLNGFKGFEVLSDY